MGFYEVIFENGDHSVITGTDDEVVSFATEHTRRAKAGEPGGPTGEPASRVKRVLAYSGDPGDLSANPHLSKDVAKSTVAEAVKNSTDENGVVDMNRLANLLIPQAITTSPPHESNYSAQEDNELDASLWGGE
jgi:hypothetical protein